ncbi:MAG: CotH kinase family protein [Oscillospiraceae bacterium]|nr:CotH kinase family protein [Oscillospiraceae bacterium]MDD4414200.1 CotH kinase family protein [Oscillospiraceae bacterium]
MKKHKSYIRITTAIMIIALLLSGCNSPADQTALKKYSEIESKPDISQSEVTDNSQLYVNDDPYSVITMYLTVKKGNESDGTNHTWKEVNSYSTYYYDENNIDRYKVEGILQIGDESGPLPEEFGYNVTVPNATVQVRGKTTSRAEQKSFQIKIKKDKGFWRDQRSIILNKHIYDFTRFRNKLSYDLMCEYPALIGSRTQFVHLYVRDMTEGGKDRYVDYGLYTQVEQMNSRYLLNHGLDRNGHLYKASMFEFMKYDALKLTTDPKYDLNAFEKVLEIKGDNDHTKLLKMIDDLNDYSLPIEEVFKRHFDEENYFSWLAFQTLTGNTDISSQNFLLYSPLNSPKWYFIPWDNDGAWNHIGRIEQSGRGYNYFEGVSNYWGAVLHQRMLKSEILRAKLDEKIEYFRKELSKEKLLKMVDNYRKVVQPYLYSMPDIEHAEKTEKEYPAAVRSMVDEIEYNYNMYKESLKHPMPYYVDLPAVNGDKLRFAWDNSFDFNNEVLEYTFELSKDYRFKTTINKESGIILPEITVPMLPDGQYFYKITVKNESGETQTAMDYYMDINDIKHYGVVGFYIEDGIVFAGTR